MTEQEKCIESVANFAENCLRAGLTNVADRAYEYALALQEDTHPREERVVTAVMMYTASEWVKNAMPKAHKYVEMSKRSW